MRRSDSLARHSYQDHLPPILITWLETTELLLFQWLISMLNGHRFADWVQTMGYWLLWATIELQTLCKGSSARKHATNAHTLYYLMVKFLWRALSSWSGRKCLCQEKLSGNFMMESRMEETANAFSSLSYFKVMISWAHLSWDEFKLAPVILWWNLLRLPMKRCHRNEWPKKGTRGWKWGKCAAW